MSNLYCTYRVELYRLNCKVMGVGENINIINYIKCGTFNNTQLCVGEEEVIKLLDEFTLLNCFESDVDLNTIISNTTDEIKQSLRCVNRGGYVRKNKKKDYIYNFLYKNHEHLNNILLTHIIILILRTLQYSNFDVKFDNKNPTINNNKCMLQKTISIVYENLKIFLDFFSLNRPTGLVVDYEGCASIIFYILNIMANTKCGNFNVIEIDKKKIIKVDGMCTINVLTTKYKIHKSIWSDINTYSKEFTLKELNNVDYLCPPLFLYATNVIKQKYSKPNSEYTDDFKQTVLLMANTKIHICYNMLSELRRLVDMELKILLRDEEVILKKFKVNIDNYNKYKSENNLKVCDFWLTSTLDVLIDDYKRVTINDSMGIKKINLLKEIYVDLETTSTIDVAKQFEKTKNFLTIEKQRVVVDINKKKHLLQLEISKLQKHLSKIASYNFCVAYYNYLIENKISYFYLPTYSDFRGRLYYKSQISIQSGWMYRYLYHLGDLDKSTYGATPVQLPMFFEQGMYEAMRGVGVYDLKLFYAIFSLGLVMKEVVESKNGFKSMGDIFYNGIVVYKKYGCGTYSGAEVGCKKLAEIIYLSNIINSVNIGVIKMWYIIKDTTASVHQHMGKILGFKPDSLKLVNLYNTYDMYDTYELYVNFFKKTLENSDCGVVKYITRGLLKKTIMTVPYGIGSRKAFKNFCDHVSDLDIPEVNKLDLLKVFNKIYRILDNQIIETKYLYIKNKNEFKTRVLDFKKLEVLDFKIHINYFNTKKVVIEYKILNKRKSMVVNIVDINSINKQKTEIAAFVNTIHMLDAAYLRRLVRKLKVVGIHSVTIHDAFCVPFYDVGFLILYANDAFLINEDCGIFTNVNADVNVKSESILI